MSFSGGTFTFTSNSFAPTPVTGTTISSTAAASTWSELATALTTCVLKDGTQTLTANIPMGTFILTGLGAGSASGHSMRYEQVLGVATTAGDTLYATAAGTLARLAIGSANTRLAVNAGATAPTWVADTQNTVVDAKGDLLVGTAADTVARLAVGSNDTVLTADSAQATGQKWADPTTLISAASETVAGKIEIATQAEVDAATSTTVALTPERKRITLGTEQASTSGTAIDFTSIPAGTRRITIMFSGVSLSGTDDLLVQLGDAGGIEATGYLGSSTSTTYTTGFGFNVGAAANVFHGVLNLYLENSTAFRWVAQGIIGFTSATTPSSCGGAKALSAELDRVRITTNGTNTFDAGVINISYER